MEGCAGHQKVPFAALGGMTLAVTEIANFLKSYPISLPKIRMEIRSLSL